ncbi:unnamed protein product [marine sediment metagenome]|uniref:Uncharacterized protein n=1 Tax=marine sediment metagenome TaxID=412755 RepID=X1D6A3_9ZZZZ
MLGPSFTINGKSVDFYLNTKTKQWHIGSITDPFHIVSKAKGEAIIKFLEALQERLSIKGKIEIKKEPYSV